MRQIGVSIQFSHTIMDKFKSGCHFPTDSKNLSPPNTSCLSLSPQCVSCHPLFTPCQPLNAASVYPVHSLSVTIHIPCVLLLATTNPCAPLSFPVNHHLFRRNSMYDLTYEQNFVGYFKNELKHHF